MIPTMHVFVLGATGHVGTIVSRRIRALDAVTTLTVAGRDPRRVRGLAAQLDATAVIASADDEDALSVLLEDCDVVVNVAGPDESVLLPALRSAIRSGTPYCDVSADGATIETALDLHEDAVSAGVTALVGIGSAPGFTNLLCRHAVTWFDEVDELRFGYLWECPQPDDARRLADAMTETGRADASWETLLRYVAGPVRIVRDGRLQRIDTWAQPQRLLLPGGGEFTGYAVDSAEPITLARNLPDVREIVSIVGMDPPSANDDWRVITPAQAVVAMHRALAESPAIDRATPPPARVPIGINATGRSRGEVVTYAAEPSAMWMSASVMVTAACAWLVEERRAAGVFAPEAVLDPLPFFTSAAGIWGGELSGEPLLVESGSAVG